MQSAFVFAPVAVEHLTGKKRELTQEQQASISFEFLLLGELKQIRSYPF